MGEILKGQSKAEAVRRAAGAIMINGQQVADTLQCAHCGKHWIPVRGSGRVRGFCTNCNGVTCGEKPCDKCVPLGDQLDAMEAVGKLRIKVIRGYNSFNKVVFQFRVPLELKEVDIPEEINKDAIKVDYEVMTVNEANALGIK